MTTEQESPQQESPAAQRPSVKTFRPTTFELCQFEVIAKGGDLSNFAATDFACVEKTVQVSDSMFEVFDDIEASPVSEDSEAATEDSELGGQVGASEEESVETEFADGEEITEYVRELKQEVARLEEERTALEEEHARQLEEVRQEVEKESAERVKAVEERYATLIEDMNTQIHEGIDGVERRALALALQVAKKLVGTTVEVNPEYILGIIKEATKLTGGATIKAIRVSPQDLEFLKMLSPDKQFKEFDGSWSFQADETIHAGCVVETSSGQVELDLDKAWEKIKESVIKVR